MTQDEIQAVARAIEGVRLFVRWNDWTSDHVPGLPIEICRWTGDYDESCEVVARYPGKHENDGEKHLEHHVAEARALSAIAALDEARGKAEPVAWMYHHPGDIEHGWQRYEFRRRIQSYEGMSCIEEDAGMIETPLYAHPPAPDAARGDPVARVVEWLRKENGLCDCHARCETECGCGAWDDWKTKPLLEIADAIEQSFANKT